MERRRDDLPSANNRAVKEREEGGGHGENRNVMSNRNGKKKGGEECDGLREMAGIDPDV